VLGILGFLAVLVAIGTNAIFDAVGLGPAWLISSPAVAAAFGILYGLLDRFAWRWAILRRLGLIETPDASGCYEGSLCSSYNGTTLPVELVIEQTWTRIVVRFRVVSPATSESTSLSASIVSVGHDVARITYAYRNTVRAGFADVDMNDHDGTAELTIDKSSEIVSGRYYNYRGRQGSLDLRRVED
jgi:hypothetical protein